jgi:hypothetical protein
MLFMLHFPALIMMLVAFGMMTFMVILFDCAHLAVFP